jgi:hypothetical protein
MWIVYQHTLQQQQQILKQVTVYITLLVAKIIEVLETGKITSSGRTALFLKKAKPQMKALHNSTQS